MIDKICRREAGWHTYDKYAMGVIQNFPLCRDLLNAPALLRLRDVSFLGGMDFFSQEFEAAATRRFSRLEHSVGVAYLASKLTRKAGADEKVANAVLAAALLHDVGHGAFSHSIEPYFIRKFGMNHHCMTERLICGDVLARPSVREILNDHRVCPKDVMGVMRGAGFCGQLFRGPINIDTLDGISRAANSFGVDVAVAKPDELVQVFNFSGKSQILGDLFWRIKGEVYGGYILQPKWAAYDAAIVAALDVADGRVSPADFLLTDAQFEVKFYTELSIARDRLRRDRRGFEWLASKFVQMRGKRLFLVNEQVQVHAAEDLALRYREGRDVSWN